MICRICDSTDLVPAIDLGLHPWCNHFLRKEEIGREPVYPLRVVFCQDCSTAQLDYTVKKEVMFGDHTYLSGVTKSLAEHFCKIAVEVDNRFFKTTVSKSVLDIGSNDGTQLKYFQKLGYDVLGVESSKTTAKIAQDEGVPTLNTFFNFQTSRSIGKRFHAINAAGVFFHLEELHSVADGIRESLREDGVFIIQFLYMKSIVDNLAFDQIYHEHLLYYNLHPLQRLLDRHGLEIFDAYLAPIHGGSMIAFVSHKGRGIAPTSRLIDLKNAEERDGYNTLATYQRFAERINEFKAQNLEFLTTARQAGKRVWGFGAPVKGNTMLNYFGVGTNLIECLVERNELRRGLYAPGSHIPIVIEQELHEHPDIYYVLAWNFKKEILERNQVLIDRGIEFYFPVNPREV
jgi:SAM-dependent methyltransferase